MYTNMSEIVELEIQEVEDSMIKSISKIRLSSDSGHDSFVDESENETRTKIVRKNSISQFSSDTKANETEHLLTSNWKLSFRINNKKLDGNNETIEVANINSIESFWKVFNHLAAPSKIKRRTNPNLMFFRSNISPTWEDEHNVNGGMWSIILKDQNHRNGILDQIWMETLLACIGETLSFGEKINGIIVQRRQKEDRIQLWTSGADEVDVQYSIGHHYKQLLNLDDSIKLCYTKHNDMEKLNHKNEKSSVNLCNVSRPKSYGAKMARINRLRI